MELTETLEQFTLRSGKLTETLQHWASRLTFQDS